MNIKINNNHLFKILSIVFLLFINYGCGCKSIIRSNEILHFKATAQVWQKDTCGTLGYRAAIAEILYEHFKMNANVKSNYIKNLIGKPDTIISSDIEMEWHYLVEGINCNETYYALSVNEAVVIFINKKTNRMTGVSRRLY